MNKRGDDLLRGKERKTDLLRVSRNPRVQFVVNNLFGRDRGSSLRPDQVTTYEGTERLKNREQREDF